MVRRTIVAVLLAAIMGTPALAGGAARRATEEAKAHVENVREKISRLGVGPDARVDVRLRDKTRRKGYVTEVTADGFVVRDAESGQDSAVAFADVDRVKGRNLSTGVKIAIWAGVGAGAVLLGFIVFLYLASD